MSGVFGMVDFVVFSLPSWDGLTGLACGLRNLIGLSIQQAPLCGVDASFLG